MSSETVERLVEQIAEALYEDAARGWKDTRWAAVSEGRRTYWRSRARAFMPIMHEQIQQAVDAALMDVFCWAQREQERSAIDMDSVTAFNRVGRHIAATISARRTEAKP